MVVITITQKNGKNKIIYYHININNIKMGNNFKDIDVKNRTYYFPNEMINIKKIIQKKLRKTKSHTKIFLFVILDR